MEIIQRALREGRTMLSEYESKLFLAAQGIPVTKELLAETGSDLKKAIQEIGFPLVLKGCSPHIAHKTEKGLIRTDVRNEEEAEAAFFQITAAMEESDKAVLVQEMVQGKRELVMGLTRDPQFGPCVMFGLGGIFTEILRDVSFRVAPLEKKDGLEMMQEIKGRTILEPVRGMEAADLEQLCGILMRLGQIGLNHESIKEIDTNPVILSGSKPVAVDALIVLEEAQG